MQDSIITFKSPKSQISEAFRNMRTNITFSDIDNELQVLAVTSSSSSEGKTTIISNYAVALAQSGKRILLMDCDLRRPQIHRKFDLTNKKGLTNILLKEIPIADGIQKTEVPNLFIIASGPIPPNPSEILASRRMGELITELKKDFDYVLLDAPPLGLVTDAAVLSSVAEGYIIVVSLGESDRDGVKYVIETIQNISANIIGVVANKVRSNKRYMDYGYHGYYEEERPVDKKTKKKKWTKQKEKLAK
ncbi:MAG: CpsD/CapB family tyrosine-protein kinase [Eubacteriaceae bacterium]|nr:CpsD/CapB family tyrosine-protein kinase [Eubacteriaceae bacterium]